MPFHATFANVLSQTGITQESLHGHTGITQSDISKMVRGARFPGPELLNRIMDAVPAQHHSMLLTSWIETYIEEGFGGRANLVRIKRSDSKGNEGPFENYDPERKAILEWLLKAVNDQHLLPMLRVLWRQFNPEATPRAGKSRTARRGTRRKTST